MDKFQLQKLRDLPIEGVAERLGLRVERHKCLCPFHDDHNPSLTFKNNKFRCWSCGESGDTIKLAEKMLGASFLEACKWLADEHNVILTEYKPKEPNSSPKGGGWEGAKYARFFLRPFLNEAARKFLFEERKLDERVVRWCRLTSWRDKQGVNWLQIPYFDREGKLIGVQNRNLENRNLQTPSNSPLKGEKAGESSAKDSLPLREGRGGSSSLPLSEGRGGSGAGRSGSSRFRFPRGSECGIYNLPVLSLLRPGEDLYITEGPSDCWAMLSAGHKAIAIPSATLLTKPVLDQLSIFNLQSSIRLHMYPDRDLPGERLFLQLKQVLPGLEHHQLPPDCKDFSEMYLKMKGPPDPF